MKINKTLTALIAGASLGLSGQAMAIGTSASTIITNQATLDFKVGGLDQTQEVNSATFKVDNKIDLSISWNDVTAPTAVPNEDGVVIGYKLYNAGNNSQSYMLTASHETTEGTTIGAYSTEYQNGAVTPVPFPASPGYTYSFYQETNTTSGLQTTGTPDTLLGTSQTGDITPAALTTDLTDDLKATIIYMLVDNVPAGAFDEDILGFTLRATTHKPSVGLIEENDIADTDILGTVQNVFADASTNGFESAQSAIDVVTAKLTLDKSVEVIEDPINGTLVGGNKPKAIPGATLRYTLIAKNVGRAGATEVTVNEDLTLSDTNNVNLADLDLTSITGLDTGTGPTAADSATLVADFISTGKLNVVYNSIPAGDVTEQTRTITFDIDIK